MAQGDGGISNGSQSEDDDAGIGSLTSSDSPTPLRTKIAQWLRTPSPAHVLVIAVLGSLGGGLALPQEIPIIREFACDWYYKKHPSSSAGDDRCQIPEVAQLAGEVVTIARMFNAVITVFCLTLYSDLLSRYGRKPMFAFTAFCLTCSIVLFGLGAFFRGPLGITLISINFIFSGIGSQPLLQLTFQSYIVDCVKTEERSPTFALLSSATFGGLAIASLCSSLMTTYSKIPLLPFWVGAVVFFLMLLYSLFVLPEALTPERRKELMDANEATQQSGGDDDDAGEENENEESEEEEIEHGIWRFLRRINFLKKLEILLPKKKVGEEKRDYRLLILVMAFGIYRIGGLYTNDLLLLTTTGSFGFTGAENGILVAFVTASKAILLMGILPFVIRRGRDKYSKWVYNRSTAQPGVEGLNERSRLLANKNASERRNGDSSSSSDEETEKPDGSERFDLYFGALSFVIDAIALSGVGLSKDTWHLYASTALLSVSSAGGPSLQAVITEITSKALTDQVMATTGLIENICAILSPLILGSVYSTAGRVAWFVSAALYILAALVMLCTPSKGAYMGHKSKRAKRRKVAVS